MASVVGGTVTWVLDVETGRFTSGLASAKLAVKSATDDIGGSTKKVNSHFQETAASVSQSLGTIASTLGRVTIATGLAIGASSYGIMGMAKASWDQVVAVENATFALKAYEKDAGKVSNVLSELVKYAQSDMGVLFQRQDLFDAASTMKLYGIETSKLVDYTKILSKGVAVGKTSFQELSDIMGRVASSGQLTGDAFDMLVMRGIKLPDTMRNAKVSAEELFQALDKSLPDELLVGRANTISGIMTRLQSAFRNLGSQILGVDKETSQFIKGGLGDTLVTTMVKLRDIMASPAMKESFANLGKSIGNFVKNALPLLIKGFAWMANNLPAIIALFGALATAWIVASVAAIVLQLAAIGITWPVYAIVGAIILMIGVLTYLQRKFGFVTKVMKALQPIFKFVGDIFKELWKSVKDLATVLGKELAPVFAFISKHAEVFKKILMVTTLMGFAPLLFVIGSAIAALKLLAIVIGFLANHFRDIINVMKIVYNVFFWNIIEPIKIIMKVIKDLDINWSQVWDNIGNAVDKIKNKLSEFKKIFGEVISDIKTNFAKISNSINTAKDNINSALDTSSRKLETFGRLLVNAFKSDEGMGELAKSLDNINDKLASGINNVLENWSKTLEEIKKKITNFVDNIPEALKLIKKHFSAGWENAKQATIDFFTGLPKQLTTHTDTATKEIADNSVNGLAKSLKKESNIRKVGDAILLMFTLAIVAVFIYGWDLMFRLGGKIISGINTGIIAGLTALGNIGIAVYNWLVRQFANAITWLYNSGMDIIYGLVNGISNKQTTVTNKFKEIRDNINNFFLNGISWLFIAGTNVLQGFINGITGMYGALWASIAEVASIIGRFFAGAWNWLVGAGQAVVGGLARGISSMAGALWGAIAGVSSAIGNFFAGAGGWLYGAGRNIIQGLVNGISSMAGAVYEAANRIASNVKNTISNALKIKSPSKIMFGFGENISQGLAKGIDSSSGQVQASSLGIANVVQAPMVDMKNSGPNVNNNETSININGNIMLGDKSAVDEFFAKLNRNNELARKGMALS